MTNLALYELSDQYREALATLGDLDLDDQTIADTLEGLVGEIQEKATNVAMFCRNLEASAEAIKEAEAKMAARRKSIEARSAWLKSYLLANMQQTGITKIECPYFKISLRDNPAKVIIDDADQIPAQFLVVPVAPPPSPDKKAINDSIKSGVDVPGCHLEKGQRVEIR
jgi:hypothetical protein